MFSMCKPNTAWWDSVITGNLKLFNEQIMNYVGKPDLRPSDAERGVYEGFTALHYAVLFEREEFLGKLLPLELSAYTAEVAKIPARGISEAARVQLPSHSNALQIAIFTGNEKIIAAIIGHILHAKAAQFDLDDFQRSPLQVAGMVRIDLRPFMCDYFMEQITSGGEADNFVQNCCYFGRFRQLKQFYGYFYHRCARLVNLMFLQLDEKKRCVIDLCDAEVDYVKINTSSKEKQGCRQLCLRACERAIKQKGCDETIEAFLEVYRDGFEQCEEEFETEEEKEEE